MEQLAEVNKDTIAAIATPHGSGGVAIIRISGPEAFSLVGNAWRGKSLEKSMSHSVHLGNYISLNGEVLDQCVATVFKAPASYTGENTVELGIHGSLWIQREILSDLVRRGVRIAAPGEFTQRAFVNGRLDLAQAEGVADLISASSRAAHNMALRQTDGSFSREFKILRQQLIEFASLIELELDFSEEEVEFADRSKLLRLCNEIRNKIRKLTNSYATGKVLKDGVPVVIAGLPNAGKSSLLNLLLGNDKAIVTDIPGTTRDLIEDTVEIDGILFRFIDTAGIRTTDDIVEQIGVNRTLGSLKKAFIVIWMIDLSAPIETQLIEFKKYKSSYPDTKTILLLNKSDLKENTEVRLSEYDAIKFSTITQKGLEELTEKLSSFSKENTDFEKDLIVTNARHFQALTLADRSLERAGEGLETGLSGDFIAQDIRETLHHLGLITGEITTDTLLQSIFSSFCIGK